MTLQQPIEGQPSGQHTQPSPLTEDVDVITEITAPAVAAATSFQQHVIETMAAGQTEWLGFLNERWHENLGLASQLSRCRSLLEIQFAYLGYWVRASAQYSKEYQRLNAIVRADGASYRRIDTLRELRG